MHVVGCRPKGLRRFAMRRALSRWPIIVQQPAATAGSTPGEGSGKTSSPSKSPTKPAPGQPRLLRRYFFKIGSSLGWGLT